MESILFLLFSILAVLVVLGLVWRQPPFPARPLFSGMLVFAGWWAACVALEGAAPAPAGKLLWAEMAWLGIVGAPSCLTLFVLIYTGVLDRRGVRPLAWVAAVMALATWLVALTNDQHALMYREVYPAEPEPGAPLVYIHGAWFYAVTIYMYAVMLAAAVVTVQALRRASPPYRRHLIGILLVLLLPWAVDASYVIGGVTVFGLEPAPFTFTIIGAVLAWLILRQRLFLLPPIARDALLDVIPDAVLVLDREGGIIEANRAARLLAGLPRRPGPSDPSLSQVPALAELLHGLGPQGEGLSGDLFFAPAKRYFEPRSVPLRQGGTLVGRLLVFRDITDRKQVELELQDTLRSLQRQLESNLTLQGKLREQATRDALTGAYNRHFLDEIKAAVLLEAETRHQPVAVVLLDLDSFKEINDRFGHLAGDRVLAALGDCLNRGVRASDFVFRPGGDEFLVLLPGLDAGGAEARLRDWRDAFAACRAGLPQPESFTTFSAGIAAYPADGTAWEQLLSRADAALYDAKQGGRDRTRRWRGERPDLRLPPPAA